jgi:hypothetical protein
MTIQFSIINELKKPLDFNDLCSICGCNSGSKHILPCNHYFHYDCLLKYLQSEPKNASSTNDCPYCRQSFGYLPLEPGMKPIKYIHLEYKRNTKTNNNINNQKQENLCAGYYLSGKNKGNNCLNYSILGSTYCRFHNKNKNTNKNTNNET